MGGPNSLSDPVWLCLPAYLMKMLFCERETPVFRLFLAVLAKLYVTLGTALGQKRLRQRLKANVNCKLTEAADAAVSRV